MNEMLILEGDAEPANEGAGTALALIPAGGPLVATEIFKPGGVEALLEKIEREVLAVKTDISTEKGRKAIRSLAYQVARSKTALDEMGKELGAEWAKKKEKVDADRRLARGRMDALAEKVRAPLARWEARETARIAAHEAALAAMIEAPGYGERESSSEIEQRLAYLRAYPARDWQEFEQRAVDALAGEISRTEGILLRVKAREAEEAERARIAAEEAEAARIAAEEAQAERERQIAAAAAEQARVEAEERAAAQARAAAEEAEANARRIEAEAAAKLREAEEKAEAETRAAEQRAKDAEAARKKAEADAAQAAADAVAAVEAERRRVAKEAAEAYRAEEERFANREHQGRINRKVHTALMQLGLADDTARMLILAIVRGEVPHVKVHY